ncbi:MAG TPA: hypothetical protein VM554_06795 [Acidisarcina sp.]|nr:hypothetical protein [Acidisarcina sp.]
MRAFRPLILASAILAGGLMMASSATAQAGVRVYVAAGPAGPGYYADGGYPAPYPGCRWVPAYTDAYGNYYPGQWIAIQGRGDHEWREHEQREHEWREHEWREHEGDRGYGYREGRREWRHGDEDGDR